MNVHKHARTTPNTPTVERRLHSGLAPEILEHDAGPAARVAEDTDLRVADPNHRELEISQRADVVRPSRPAN
jgi:hypothetical protein